jgi:hypothetical protein
MLLSLSCYKLACHISYTYGVLYVLTLTIFPVYCCYALLLRK